MVDTEQHHDEKFFKDQSDAYEYEIVRLKDHIKVLQRELDNTSQLVVYLVYKLRDADMELED